MVYRINYQFICVLIFGLMWGITASANDLRPWGETNDFVQLDKTHANNQHPVKFSAEQIATLLGEFFKREQKNKEPVRYFSQDEITRLSTELVPLFAKAKPGEDIVFGTSFRPGNFVLIPRLLNAGRLFVENGQLNLLAGMCAKVQDITYQQTMGKYRELDHGNRNKPVDKLDCELLEGNNTQRVNQRSDWVKLNITQALTTRSVPMFATSTPLTFGATVSAVEATITRPEIVPAASLQATLPEVKSVPASETEQRLIVLKRLHDSGLITDSEYTQKREALLKAL